MQALPKWSIKKLALPPAMLSHGSRENVPHRGPRDSGALAGNARVPHIAGFLNTLRFLVENHGIAVNVLDDQKRTALHWAAREGRLNCCRYLVSKGCYVACKVWCQ